MTTPAQTNPVAVADFTLDGSDAAFIGTPYQIWQVPGTTPVRIDAVAFTVTIPTTTINGEAYGISYVVPGGSIQFQQWSPQFATTDMDEDPDQLWLTWMRGASGSDQLPPSPSIQGQAGNPNEIATGTFPLPDIVLQPSTVINLTRANGLDAGSDIITVSGLTITYTEGTGPTSSTTLGDVTPYLLPQANS